MADDSRLSRATGSETILLVEDAQALRELVRNILRQQGYTVLEARHGGDAVLVCEQHLEPIHLMLTDVVMPHLRGHELFERLSPLVPGMRVLYMSGFPDTIVDKGVAQPGAAFLAKPFKPAALVAKVREVLDSREPAG